MLENMLGGLPLQNPDFLDLAFFVFLSLIILCGDLFQRRVRYTVLVPMSLMALNLFFSFPKCLFLGGLPERFEVYVQHYFSIVRDFWWSTSPSMKLATSIALSFLIIKALGNEGPEKKNRIPEGESKEKKGFRKGFIGDLRDLPGGRKEYKMRAVRYYSGEDGEIWKKETIYTFEIDKKGKTYLKQVIEDDFPVTDEEEIRHALRIMKEQSIEDTEVNKEGGIV